jgi:transposase
MNSSSANDKNHTHVLGIDVGKHTLDAALMTITDATATSAQQAQFPNTPTGHERLRGWAQKLLPPDSRLHVCLEATGPYWDACAEDLHRWATTVSVVNPRAVRAFGQARLRRNKTDKADARLIAIYTAAMHPSAWTPPSSLQRQMQTLQWRIDSLKAQRIAELTRLEKTALPTVVSKDIQSHIRLLDARIEKLDAALRKLIATDAIQAHNHELLVSIPGIATRTAAALQCELADIARFETARQLAAHAGLTPRHHQSGLFAGRTRLSKIGSSRLRARLYMSAIAAKKHSAPFIVFAQRLRANAIARGTHLAEKAVVCAIMRKLVHIVFGVLKSQQPFNPNLVTPMAKT